MTSDYDLTNPAFSSKLKSLGSRKKPDELIYTDYQTLKMHVARRTFNLDHVFTTRNKIRADNLCTVGYLPYHRSQRFWLAV